jgi:putative protease
MATRKKAKPKLKRKKIAARKPLKRTAAPKPAKKAPLRRVAAKRAPVAKPAPAAKPAPQPAPPPGERIGVVTHYFSHLSVAVLRLESGTRLRVGDAIHFKGHTTDFGQRVESLEVNHQPVQEVGPGDDFGLKVAAHVREHDVVYRVK